MCRSLNLDKIVLKYFSLITLLFLLIWCLENLHKLNTSYLWHSSLGVSLFLFLNSLPFTPLSTFSSTTFIYFLILLLFFPLFDFYKICNKINYILFMSFSIIIIYFFSWISFLSCLPFSSTTLMYFLNFCFFFLLIWFDV